MKNFPNYGIAVTTILTTVLVTRRKMKEIETMAMVGMAG